GAVRVVAAQWAAGALTERIALEGPRDPAQLLVAPSARKFAPLAAPTQGPADLSSKEGLRTAALSAREWLPVLMVGSTPAVQSAILETGDLAKPGAEEIVRQSGRDTASFAKSAADAFGGPRAGAPPATAPSKILTAAWIDYEIRTPDAPPQKVRRTIFDLIGPSGRAAGQSSAPHLDDTATLSRSLALTMTTEILPIVCRVAPQFVAHLAAEGILANRDLLTALARGDVPDDVAHAQDVAKHLAPLPSSLYGLARARFE